VLTTAVERYASMAPIASSLRLRGSRSPMAAAAMMRLANVERRPLGSSGLGSDHGLNVNPRLIEDATEQPKRFRIVGRRSKHCTALHHGRASARIGGGDAKDARPSPQRGGSSAMASELSILSAELDSAKNSVRKRTKTERGDGHLDGAPPLPAPPTWETLSCRP
jgi:hypothetical protein